MKLPDFSDIAAAAERLRPHAFRTPVLSSRTADRLTGATLYFKCENFQRTGSFKFRGAYNAIAMLNDEQRRKGVVAFSAGNHAQAVALSARLLGTHALIIMPSDVPAPKLAAVRDYGCEVRLFDRLREDREKIAQEAVDGRGMSLIPPYDHPAIVAGQGTAALELLEETGPLDYIFTPVGGGGMVSGTILAARQLAPSCRVVGVEPEAANDAQQSLRGGSLVRIPAPETIADGARTQALGHLPFDIIRGGADDILTVPDTALVDAMHFFAERMKIIVEPTGCLGFAGALDCERIKGKRIGILLSGGNVDLAQLGPWFAARSTK